MLTDNRSLQAVHVEWGLAGAIRLGSCYDVSVIVDVLSFATTVTVALDRGWEVLPYQWGEASAASFARDQDAVLALGRSQAVAGQVSLSPQSVRAATGSERRLVLPSPNGATIAAALSDTAAPSAATVLDDAADAGRGVVVGGGGVTGSGGVVGGGTGVRQTSVMTASLRNAEAMASWLTGQYQVDGARLLLVAAGEQWPGGQLRPAIEDLWGAGAVASGLRRRGWSLTVEAVAAVEAYDVVCRDLPVTLQGCTSGRELVAMGFGGDVEIAAEVDQSLVVPELVLGVFHDVR